MITLDFSGGNRFRAVQRATEPCIYLDQWAYMLFVKEEQQLERFADGVVKSGGTLAFSVFNFYELSKVSDLAQLRRVENLLARIWPRLVFLNSDPTEVISREDMILLGTLKEAPHLDDQMLKMYVELYRPGVNPLDPKGFVLQVRNPGMPEGLQVAYRCLAEKMKIGIQKARSRYQVDRDAKREVNSSPRGVQIPHPTRYIFDQAVYSVVKDNLDVRNPNHFIDFFHTVVPLSYCNIVVLDKA